MQWVGKISNMFEISPILPNSCSQLGSTHLETVLYCLSTCCCSHFLSCPILLPYFLEALAGLSYSSTRKSHSMKNQPVLSNQDLTWSLPIKMGSLFCRRVGFITAGQGGKASLWLLYGINVQSAKHLTQQKAI